MSGFELNICSYLNRFTILTIYAVFFLVQAESDSINQNFNAPSSASVSSISHSLHKKCFSSKTKDSQKTNFRLNKRYHPESFTMLDDVSLTPHFVFIVNKKISKPEDYLLISSILSDSLRGPPVVG